MKWIGAYYSWTNKRVWGRIDRVFTNVLWYETMDYTQTHYLPSSLLDHNPLLIQFSSSPRPLARFHFCDMWTKHKDFGHITTSIPSTSANLPKLQQLKIYLDKLRPKLMKLNRHHFADLRTQQDAARLELTTLQSKMAEASGNAQLIKQEHDLKKEIH